MEPFRLSTKPALLLSWQPLPPDLRPGRSFRVWVLEINAHPLGKLNVCKILHLIFIGIPLARLLPGLQMPGSNLEVRTPHPSTPPPPALEGEAFNIKFH